MDRRAFAALALVALGGCVIAPLPPADEPYAPEQGPEVESAPPPPQAETPPPMPGAGYIWIGGWWRWHLGRHVWVAGRWARPPAGHAWVPGHWTRTPRGWRWTGGHWRRHR